MPAGLNERRLPGAEDEARLWAVVEAAWAQCSAEASRVRRALAARAPDPDAGISAVDGALPVFLGALAHQCRELPGGELASLDRVLERKLYDIDRGNEGYSGARFVMRSLFPLRRAATIRMTCS